MSFKDLNLNISYETTENRNDLVSSFYIPVLKVANLYCRIAGYFSSSSLSIAAEGIESLIKNGGKMKLLISPELSADDYNVLKNSEDTKVLYKNFDINDFKKDEHLLLLAWMLANEKLEIKIVVNKQSHNSIFHQKVGILFDSDNNRISFSGSVNESAQAWINNIEEFKVFKSWIDGQEEYVNSDLQKFSDYWTGQRKAVSDVYDIPDSIKKEIINVVPRDINELSLMKEYIKNNENKVNRFKPFDHQINAIEEWENNDRKLFMEMATGTGKTRTALGCCLNLLKEKEKFIAIVATPQGTLSRQWKDDVNEIGINFEYSELIDGSNVRWRQNLISLLLDVRSDILNNAIIFCTHSIVCKEDFINIIREYKKDTKILFICDEVHGIGSDKQKNALLEEYEYRIGLSATPERMFDEFGSNLIRNYFGNKSFEFTIHDALNTINEITGKPFLNRYFYNPIFINLNEDELVEYKRITRQIIIEKNSDYVDEAKLNQLYNKRANIIKNADLKKNALVYILSLLESEGKIKDTIIFVSDEQREYVMSLLSEKGIIREKITEEESASKIVNNKGESERQDIISKFKSGDCQVLLGLKCLDEGIDIPNARIAILMASSTNPREYIQRIGRVIRQAPNKEASFIYDIIVDPGDGSLSSDSILYKEAKRALYIAKNAVNNIDIINEFKTRGVTLDANK